MLSVTNELFMLGVIMLNVFMLRIVMLIVMAPLCVLQGPIL
jgi:hypothetical protein